MTGHLADVWLARDFPVLCELTRRVDAGETFVDIGAVATTLGLPRATVALAAAALERRGFTTVVRDLTGPVSMTEVSGAAYLITGLHPDADDALSSLIALLDEAADLSSDEDERSRLRRAGDGLANLSRPVADEVITAWLTSRMSG